MHHISIAFECFWEFKQIKLFSILVIIRKYYDYLIMNYDWYINELRFFTIVWLFEVLKSVI